MSPQLPGKRAFFKYASPDTTLAILKSRTVRYSSPLNFNDPFDIQSGLRFSFDVEQLPTKIVDRLEQLASSPEVSQIDPNDSWGKVVLEAVANLLLMGSREIAGIRAHLLYCSL